MSNPHVSVVMPVFNGVATIDRAIRSLDQQRFLSWELLAVDDGSADGSHERLLSWAGRDRRIHGRVALVFTSGCHGSYSTRVFAGVIDAPRDLWEAARRVTLLNDERPSQDRQAIP